MLLNDAIGGPGDILPGRRLRQRPYFGRMSRSDIAPHARSADTSISLGGGGIPARRCKLWNLFGGDRRRAGFRHSWPQAVLPTLT